MIVIVARYVSCILFGACIVGYGPSLWSDWRWRHVNRALKRSQAESHRQVMELVEEMRYRKGVREAGDDEYHGAWSVVDGEPATPWHPSNGTPPPEYR